jgi:hypothetical protein
MLFATDNPWAKVIAIPNRSELRVYQKGVPNAIAATLADATEERIVVVTKNRQMMIAKEDIEGIDARPIEPKKMPEATTTQTTADPDLAPRPSDVNLLDVFRCELGRRQTGFQDSLHQIASGPQKLTLATKA